MQRYFAEYEFSTRYLLCCSDCEALTLKELLALADDDSLARCVTAGVAPACRMTQHLSVCKPRAVLVACMSMSMCRRRLCFPQV